MKKFSLWRFRLRRWQWAAWWAITRRWRTCLWRLKGRPVPPVGSLVLYGLDGFGTQQASWRVSSWLCPFRRPEPSGQFMHDRFADILWESCQKIDGQRMQWCLPNEATHVSLTGICGAIAPIGECKVTGMVNWPEKHITEEHESAMRRGAAHQAIF